MWQRFERDAAFTIDGKGGMTLSVLDSLPNRCLRISEEDLARVTRHWQPVLESMVEPHGSAQVMVTPYTGDDWRAYGPVLSLSFGSPSETSVGLLWD